MSKKNICIVQNSIKTMYIFRKSYIVRLLEEGHSVSCFALNDSDEHIKLLEALGCVVHAKSTKRKLLSIMLLNLELIIFSFKNNAHYIVHFITSFIFFFPAIMFNKNKTNLVVEGVGSFFSNKKFALKILSLLVRVFAAGRTFMNTTERDMLGNENDLVLNGIGIDLAIFNGGEIKSEPKKIHRILYVGRLVGDKGIFDVLELARMLKLDNIDFHMDVVGDIYPGNPTSLTLDDIEEFRHEFSDNVKFHGFQSNLLSFYKAASILILPSKHEGFPVVVMEANAMGLPVICYDVVGCRDAVKNGVNGYLVEMLSIESIKKIIVKNEYFKLNESSYHYAVANYDQKIKSEIFLRELGFIGRSQI